jgi:hypothetical protein
MRCRLESCRDRHSQGSLVGFGWTSEATPENAKVNRDQRPGLARRPHRNRKLTMLIPATSENVASPHCSDECELNSQKTARGGVGIAKF